MKINPSNFRIVVVVSAVLNLCWFLAPLVPRDFPDEISHLMSFSGFGALVELPTSAWIAVLVIRVAAYIMLLSLVANGRFVFLFAVGGEIVLNICSGLWIGLPLESYLGHVAAVADGALLAVAFLCYPHWKKVDASL